MAETKSTKRSLNIMYNYFVEQYRSGLFMLLPIEVAKIGGLIMFSEMENDESYEFCYERLIPKSKLENKDEDQIQEYQKHILKQYFNFTGDRH